MAKIQVQGIGVYDDKTLKKKIIDMAYRRTLAKKGEWSKSSENGIRALGSYGEHIKIGQERMSL